MLAAFLGYQPACQKLVVRAGKIRDVNLDVVTVERDNFAPCLGKYQCLLMADLYMGCDPVPGFYLRRCPDDFP